MKKYVLGMSLIVLACLVLVYKVAAGETLILVAKQLENRDAAKEYLSGFQLPSNLRLKKGFPQLLTSKDVSELTDGFSYLVLGYCASAQEEMVHTGNNEERVLLVLRHTSIVIDEIEELIEGSYSLKVKGQYDESCPDWIPSIQGAEIGEQLSRWKLSSADTEDLYKIGEWFELNEMNFQAADYFYSLSFLMDKDFKPAQLSLYKLEVIGARR